LPVGFLDSEAVIDDFQSCFARQADDDGPALRLNPLRAVDEGDDDAFQGEPLAEVHDS